MYILTSRLIALQRETIPLPWYHRAPLGLMSGTPVHVALQRPRRRPFGDLLVSVIDPVNWPFVAEISASREDEPGVLSDVYDLAPPLNIVFAEAVTVDSGSRHDARLLLEPFHPHLDELGTRRMVKEQIARIRRELAALRFRDPRSMPLHPDHDELEWMDVGSTELGWVHVDGWRSAVLEQAARTEGADRYALDMAVVSADTDRRTLRYVFPRRGAVSVSVEHADRPGAMKQIADALAHEELNILSSLLRRGSAPPYKAEVVMVVEPTDETTDSTVVEARARGALAGLPVGLRLRVNVTNAIDPEETTLYPRRPHEIAVRPTRPMEAAIRAVREDLPAGKLPIFISRRFADETDPYNRKVVEELRRVLDEEGFVAVEALPQPGAETVVSEDVKAKMWASKAAIVLVVSTPSEQEFSVNLAHECGFMQGQGKSLLPLIEEDVSDAITRIANLQGLQRVEFGRENATDPSAHDSICQRVRPWLELVKRRNHGA